MTVTETINGIRKVHYMRQKDLAQRLGISEQYLSDILLGKRGISVYVAIGLERVLGLDARELLIAQVDDDLAKAKETAE